jgi:hypothetical protein
LTLRAVKNRLTDLFIRLIFLTYTRQSELEDTAVSIDVVEALALLLHPLSVLHELDAALSFYSTQDSLRKGADKTWKEFHREVESLEGGRSLSTELQQTQHLWFALVLFRIKESTRWSHYENWFAKYLTRSFHSFHCW